MCSYERTEMYIITIPISTCQFSKVIQVIQLTSTLGSCRLTKWPLIYIIQSLCRYTHKNIQQSWRPQSSESQKSTAYLTYLPIFFPRLHVFTDSSSNALFLSRNTSSSLPSGGSIPLILHNCGGPCITQYSTCTPLSIVYGLKISSTLFLKYVALSVRAESHCRAICTISIDSFWDWGVPPTKKLSEVKGRKKILTQKAGRPTEMQYCVMEAERVDFSSWVRVLVLWQIFQKGILILFVLGRTRICDVN